MEDIVLIKDKLDITITDRATYIIVLLVDNRIRENTNKLLKIPCKTGDYCSVAYDTLTDSIIVECVEFIHLGSIPISYCIKMPYNFGWGGFLPIPPELVKKYLSAEQAATLDSLRNKYESSIFDIHYIQMWDSI